MRTFLPPKGKRLPRIKAQQEESKASKLRKTSDDIVLAFIS
jgi:hypothetical protein